jgi:transposase
MVQRAKIVLMSADGLSDTQISKSLSLSPNSVGIWRKRFNADRIDGLKDRPRSGKPPTYDKEVTRNAILSTLEKPPPKGQATWDGKLLASELGFSVDIVWRTLKKEGIHLQRQRTWCVSTDPQFAEKAADVIGLYLNPPENAIVLSVDEKTSIQALERPSGYVMTKSGEIVRGIKSTYIRHGVVNLFSALVVATGAVHSKILERKRRVEFLEFMDQVVSELPKDKEIHVIMDNYCIHKKCDEWLDAHPAVKFHYTPTSASWLNLVEVFFGIFTRKALRGANFSSIEELIKAIKEFLEVYNENAEPFIWRKREVKGSQLKNTIRNLCR